MNNKAGAGILEGLNTYRVYPVCYCGRIKVNKIIIGKYRDPTINL